MSRFNVVLSCAAAVLLAGCFSSTIKQTIAKDQLIMNRQDVTLRYQTFYDHLPGNDWARHQYRHVAENRSAVAVCVHLDLLPQGVSKPFYTTHVILQPGQKRSLSNYRWRDLLGSEGTMFTNSAKLEGTGCTEGPGWSW